MTEKTFETFYANQVAGGGAAYVSIQQQSTGRFLDAHLTAGQGYRVVTRPEQDNDTQRWQLTVVGSVYVIHQLSNGQQLSSWANADDILVTRPPPPKFFAQPIQDEVIQRWAVLGMDDGSVVIRDSRTALYVDAYLVEEMDFQVVRRPPQTNDTQRWLIDIPPPVHGSTTIRQKSTQRFMDAYQDENIHSYRVVTRSQQDNDTQRWVFTHKAFIFTVRQQVNDRFLDAHQLPDNRSVVTRGPQNDDTQRWVFNPKKGTNGYTITQLSSNLSMSAEATEGSDYRATTTSSSPLGDDTWVLAFAS